MKKNLLAGICTENPFVPGTCNLQDFRPAIAGSNIICMDLNSGLPWESRETAAVRIETGIAAAQKTGKVKKSVRLSLAGKINNISQSAG